MIFFRQGRFGKILLRTTLSLIAGLVVVLGADFVFGAFFNTRSPAENDIQYYYDVIGENKIIALAFDDGPYKTGTLEIIDILKRHNVPATFFFMGRSAILYPEIVRQVFDEGFEIGNHTFTHSEYVHSSKERLGFELKTTNKILETITGEPTVLYRPPFLLDVGGDPTFDPGAHRKELEWAKEAGYIVVGADVDSKDWEARSPEEVAEIFFRNLGARGGHISLFHDGAPGRHTIKALEPIIIELKSQGYAFATVSEVLGVASPARAAPQATGFFSTFYIFFSLSFGRAVAGAVGISLVFITLRLLFVLTLLFAKQLMPERAEGWWQDPVSVVIPVYNEEENIAATLQSAVRAVPPGSEIIVIDDGSRDSSAKTIWLFAERYPNLIRFLQVQNGGKARALNLGFQEARNEIVITLDGDTVLDENAILFLARHFTDPWVGAVAGKVCAAPRRSFINAVQYLEYVICQNMYKNAVSVLDAVGVVPGPIGAWRRSVVREIGGYSAETVVEDQDLTLAVLATGREVLFEPRATSYTETPHTLRDFVRQRFRWVFGTMQCMWKYKRYLFSAKRRAFGWVVLPDILIFGIALPLLYPLVDIVLVLTLVFDFGGWVALSYLLFLVIDFIYAGFAFAGERERRWLLLLLPVQRFFYRFVIYYVVLWGIMKAIEGTEMFWQRVQKKGVLGANQTALPLPLPLSDAPLTSLHLK